MASNIRLEDYNEAWPLRFQDPKSKLWPVVKNLAISIEHVGSTSVPGLAAKAIIDLDIVVSEANLPKVLGLVQEQGYEHLGDLGIEGREAFKAPTGSVEHHLYVCVEGCPALQNHLNFRDHLRSDMTAREAYSKLKKELARDQERTIEGYTSGKTEFILSILASKGMTGTELDKIRQANLGRAIES